MTLAEPLAVLATMSPAQLRAEWRQLYRAPPPVTFTPDLLARGIAWRLQERVMGGVPISTRRTLARLTKQLDKTGDIRLDGVPTIKPGTRLVR